MTFPSVKTPTIATTIALVVTGMSTGDAISAEYTREELQRFVYGAENGAPNKWVVPLRVVVFDTSNNPSDVVLLVSNIVRHIPGEAPIEPVYNKSDVFTYVFYFSESINDDIKK